MTGGEKGVKEEISIVYNDITEDSVYRIHSPLWEEGPYIATGAGHFFARKKYSVERNNLPMYLVLLTVSGNGLIDYHDRTFQLSPGTAVIINGMEYHRYRTDPGADMWDFLWLRFSPRGMEGIVRLADSYNTLPIPAHSPELVSWFEDFVAQADAETILQELQLSSIGARVFAELIRLSGEASSQELHKSSGGNALVLESMRRIRAGYSERLSVEELAASCYMTRFAYIRSFSRLIGVTPYQYLLRVRMDRAKLLLETTDRPITEIAQTVGFSDQNNFAKQFLKQCGVSPTRYRKQFGKGYTDSSRPVPLK